MIDAHSLAHALDGDVTGQNRVLAPGPGHSRKDRSLAVSITHDGFKVHSFAGDDWQVCRDYVRERLGLPEWQSRQDKQPSFRDRGKRRQASETSRVPEQQEPWKIAHVARVWRDAKPISDTLAHRYLESRGLTLLPEVVQADALRFHRSCPLRYGGKGEGLPAMVAAISNLRTNAPQGVHCTFLDPSGSKAVMPDGGASRRIYGIAAGGAVKLIADEDVTDGIGIAEGVETALAIMCIGWLPVWSVLSTSGLRTFPAIVGSVTIWGDSDSETNGNPGRRAAFEAVERLRAQGCEAVARLPIRTGEKADWNDILRGMT